MAERAAGPQRPGEKPSGKPAGNTDAKPKGGAGKLLLIVGIVVLSVTSGLVAAKVAVGGRHDLMGRRAAQKPEVGARVTLDEFLVNLSGPDGHYLKTTLALGLAKGTTEESIKDEVPVIRDSILAVLTGKELGDVSTNGGRDKLKDEIRSRVNRALGGEKVLEIYFTEFMTQ